MKIFLSSAVLLCLFSVILPAQNLGSNGVGFIENKGQILDQNKKPISEVLYLFPTANNNVTLRTDGFSYDTYNSEYGNKLKTEPQSKTGNTNPKKMYHRVDVYFKNANPKVLIEASEKATDYLVYATGINSDNNLVSHFNKITYKNIYPGIDVEFIANQSSNKPFEYNFILHPTADINDIQLLYKGSDSGSLLNGNIVLTLAHGQVTETIPASYLLKSKIPVDISYKLISINENEVLVGFSGAVSSYNEEPLVIDPTPHLSWGSYYGGSSFDHGDAIAIDGSGNVYIAGFTNSSGSIATSGAHQTTISGSYDAFIAKFNNAGVRQWATYFGGTSDDFATGITIDDSGNVYVVGETRSSSSISTSGAHQTTLSGSVDAFIIKLNSSGVRQWSTYYGGSGTDWAEGVCTDGSGNLFVIGTTTSSNSIATSGAHQTTYGGGIQNAFIVKFNENGVRQWGTYYGGSGSEYGKGVAIDGSGNVYVTGGANSSSGIATTGAYQTSHSGNGDVFLAKFNNNGIRQWGTYYGGTGADYSEDATIDGSGNIYVVGTTASTSSIATTGAHQTSHAGGTLDCFIVKFNSSGARQWGTYYGGTQSDNARCIATDGSNNIYITGNTQSTGGIATSGAYKTSYGGGVDAFLAKFNSSGVRQWGSYYGGSGQESGQGISAYGSGEANVYLVGYTASSSSIATSGAHQTTYGGGSYDAFIAKFTCDPTGTISVVGNFCQDGYVQLTAGSGSSYSWSTGATTQVITVYAGGAYSVSYISPTGCNKTAQTYVDDNCHGDPCPDPYNPLCPCPPGENCARMRTPDAEQEQDLIESSQLGLFPNPAKTEFNVTLSTSANFDTKIELCDMNGKAVITDIIKAGEKNKTINTQLLSMGVFLVRYLDNGVLQVKKIVIAGD